MDKFLLNLIHRNMNNKSKIAVVCISTDRFLFDAYGPLVGYLLKTKYKLDRYVQVLGDMKNPVHALNLKEVVENLNKEDMLVIAVDAAITRRKDMHRAVEIIEGPIKPGTAVRKDLPLVGNIFIKGLIYARNIFVKEPVVTFTEIAEMAERTAGAINRAVGAYIVETKVV